MTSSATGFYHFTGLTPGDYFVCFVPPAGYAVSPQNQGADDALDSDASPATGCTVATTLSPGEDDLTWDMGLYMPASAARRHRRPRVVRHQPRRHPGRRRDRRQRRHRHVRTPAGPPLSTTTTTPSGFYHFTGLTPGNYFGLLHPARRLPHQPAEPGHR